MLQRTILKNGIKIVTEKVPHAHSASIGIWIRAGSRNENKQVNGVSHFIEHMLFKGTKRHTAFDIAKIVDSVGGVINAFTGKEYTCLYVKVLHQHVALAADLLTDIFLGSLFAAEEIEKERHVIKQEIHMVKDTPDEYVQDLFSKSYFAGHPLSYPILGELETIEQLNRDKLLDFFTREYLHPPRINIATAGNIDHQQILDKMAHYFENLTLQHVCSEQKLSLSPKRIFLNYRELEQVHICLGTRGLSQLDPKRYVLYVLNAILGGSMSSRIFQEIREKHGLAYSVYSFMSSFFDTGVFGIYMAVKKDMVEKAIAIVTNELKKLQTETINEHELQMAKEQIKGNMLLAAESTDNRMSRLGKCELYYNKYIPVEDVIKKVEAVTARDIHELSLEIFKNELLNYTFLGPIKKEELPVEVMKIN